MKSPRHKRYTVDNNINATHNILVAIVESGRRPHGAPGNNGRLRLWYGGDGVPEGYLEVKVDTPAARTRPRDTSIPPTQAASTRATKTLDQLLFAFYAKNDAVRVTDLHQGMVWPAS